MRFLDKKIQFVNPLILSESKRLSKVIYKFRAPAAKLFFPPECLHCRMGHEKLGSPLCPLCASHLEARPAEDLLITFDRLSPARSLMHRFKKGSSPEIARLLAAYMAIQYTQSPCPLPDLIIGVPSTRFRKWQTLGASAETFAQALAEILERPFLPFLKRKRQLLRQDLLDREQRLELSSDDFTWKSKVSLKGKIVLLVDDTITTGSTLQCCAELLWEASPKQVIKMACLDQGYLRE